jgi:hypothetical protein
MSRKKLNPFVDELSAAGGSDAASGSSKPKSSQERSAGTASADGTEIENLPLPESDPWPVLEEEAFYGIFGEYARLVEPQTEAEVSAVLLQLLVLFGNAVGREPFFTVGATQHHANLFLALVAKTTAKKGTALDLARYFLEAADSGWTSHGIRSGLSSGEGLIQCVADAGPDEPARDKRAMILETEFGRTLTAKGRDGNTLSAVLRDAWDGRDLASLTRQQLKSTQPHISIIGHITPAELAALLARVDLANGFSNRFLWAITKRARHLPSGGQLPDVTYLRARLSDAIMTARRIGEVRRDAAAERLWEEVYGDLEDEGREDLHGEVTARAAAQCLRLSMIFALADSSCDVRPVHLRAALAVWKYCDNSARRLFAGRSRPTLAGRILAILAQAGEYGLTRTQIHNALHRNEKGEAILAALVELEAEGKARRGTGTMGGRTVEVWYASTKKRIERIQAPANVVNSLNSSNSFDGDADLDAETVREMEAERDAIRGEPRLFDERRPPA